MINRTVLIVDGSPKKKHSTSTIIGESLAEKLRLYGLSTRHFKVGSRLESDERIDKFIRDIEAADLIFLVFPLYVDSLPYNVIEALELMKEHLRDRESNNHKTFMALCQNGMEQHKNRIVLQICERFSKELNFRFGGAFALGFAGVLNGASLTSLNRLTHPLQKALTLIAESIAQERPVSQEVRRLLAKSVTPGPMFVKLFLFNFAMKRCLKLKDFNKGIDRLHSRMKLLFS